MQKQSSFPKKAKETLGEDNSSSAKKTDLKLEDDVKPTAQKKRTTSEKQRNQKKLGQVRIL